MCGAGDWINAPSDRRRQHACRHRSPVCRRRHHFVGRHTTGADRRRTARCRPRRPGDDVASSSTSRRLSDVIVCCGRHHVADDDVDVSCVVCLAVVCGRGCDTRSVQSGLQSRADFPLHNVQEAQLLLRDRVTFVSFDKKYFRL